MKRKFLASIIATVFAVSFTVASKNIVKADTSTTVGVSYQGQVQDTGWQNPVSNGQEIGTDGKGLRVEAIKLNLTNAPANAHIQYQAHVQNIGWQDWKQDGQESGTDGKSLRVEALRIKLQNMPGYSIQYRAHVQNIGWQYWVSDGQEAGTDGKSLRVEALEIRIVKTSDNSTVGVNYVGHVQNIGWQDPVENGQICGTEGQGLRVEALKLNLENAPANAHIKYQTHVQNIGWQNPVEDGQEGGTDGKGLRVEAIKISLEGMPEYSVQYRAHVEDIGWQPWVSDGQEAGTDGKGLRVEAIEARIIKTGATTTVPVSSLKLSSTNTLNIGDTETLTPEILPENATNKNLKWTSSDPSIATIDENGKVTAVKEGTTTITAATQDGSNISASCTVTVNNSASTSGSTESIYTSGIVELFNMFNYPSLDDMGVHFQLNNGTCQYETPGEVNNPARLLNPNNPLSKAGTRLYSSYTECLEANMHDGIVDKNRQWYNYYQSCYESGEIAATNCGTSFEDIKNFILAHCTDNGYANTNDKFKAVGVFTEKTSIDSMDLTKITQEAKKLNTQFITSGFDPRVTYDHIDVLYNNNTKTIDLVRFVVYQQKTN